jgi:hypothetical protein
MRCFNHNDREAVGMCKSCSKGLCSECVVDLGHGLSCRGEHERRVEDIERMVSRASRVQEAARGAKYVAPAFLCFMGLIFTGYGLLYERSPRLLLPLGVGFLAYGVVVLLANRRAYSAKKPNA